MNVEGTSHVRASPDRVWAALNDPDMLAACIPGCKSLAVTGPDAYKAVIELALGPVKGTFTGQVHITDKVQEERMTLSISARAPTGIVNATGELTLAPEPLPDGGPGTRVSWSGAPKLGGMLASVGGRLVQGAARQQAEVFFGRLETALA